LISDVFLQDESFQHLTTKVVRCNVTVKAKQLSSARRRFDDPLGGNPLFERWSTLLTSEISFCAWKPGRILLYCLRIYACN
jgi:hypothetical protein